MPSGDSEAPLVQPNEGIVFDATTCWTEPSGRTEHVPAAHRYQIAEPAMDRPVDNDDGCELEQAELTARPSTAAETKRTADTTRRVTTTDPSSQTDQLDPAGLSDSVVLCPPNVDGNSAPA